MIRFSLKEDSVFKYLKSKYDSSSNNTFNTVQSLNGMKWIEQCTFSIDLKNTQVLVFRFSFCFCEINGIILYKVYIIACKLSSEALLELSCIRYLLLLLYNAGETHFLH